MRVLLVEPNYERRRRPMHAGATRAEDDGLWYPPIGLLKIATFHRNRGDEVRFVRGCDPEAVAAPMLFRPTALWDRVYVCTVFTFDWDETIRTINHYKRAVGGTLSRIYVGGIMASLMPQEVHEATSIYPVTGVLNSPRQIGMRGATKIDLLPPAYDLLEGRPYAINRTYHAYTTRGCPRHCSYCGVARVEPEFVPYIDIKPTIRYLRRRYGDKPLLRLMDNNVLASPRLEDIVNDLLDLGYGRGQRTEGRRSSHRVVDYNQGLDAALLTDSAMQILSEINISPMRFAFDRSSRRASYVAAVHRAQRSGVRKFSTYLLYNWKDTPRDLYERLLVNIELNESWGRGKSSTPAAEVYSYPMRYAPIDERLGPLANRNRDHLSTTRPTDPIDCATWTPRSVRNLEVIKAAAHGAISPTPGLARRALGHSYEEFLANLYMPEVLLRYRNRHERRVYPHEPPRPPGTGEVEAFRRFVGRLLARRDDRFIAFHTAVSPNRRDAIRTALSDTRDKELRRWLELYLAR